MPKRGDLLGLGAGPIAGESRRLNLRFSGGGGSGGTSGVGFLKKLRAEGGGEMAESTRGDACFEDGRPNRAFTLGDVGDAGVSCEGVRL